MAYTTGTATNHADLYTKLRAFLTGNAALVASGQNWVEVWNAGVGASNASAVVLRGPGLAGQDEVFVGLQRVERPTPDEYEFQCYGMAGVISSAQSLTQHVNVQPFVTRMFTDSAPMTYWFVANGRRFVVVVKISTVFQVLHAGLFLPYAVPTVYPYPMFVGGTAPANNVTSWRSTDSGHHHFPWGYYESIQNRAECGNWMLSPMGEWLRTSGATGDATQVSIGPRALGNGAFIVRDGTNYSYGYRDLHKQMTASFSGDFPMTPMTLVQDTPSDQTFGILDGCYQVPGVANSSENIITASGVSHLVVQDAFRTGIDSYWALALE